MLVSEKLIIQRYFCFIVHLIAYWSLTSESIRMHYDQTLFSFQKSPDTLLKL